MGATVVHGSISTYSNHKCRCDECRAANAAYNLRLRDERKAGLRGNPSIHNANTYQNWGCRCDVCTAAHIARNLRRDEAIAELIRRHQSEFDELMAQP